MEILIVALIAAVVFYFVFKRKQPTVIVKVEPVKQEDDSEEIRIIKEEIRLAAQKHTHAITILQSMARIDGSISDPERNQIFSFLQRNGTGITYPRHRPLFYGYDSGEWQRAATIPEFKKLLDELESYSYEYKLDVYHTALAVVASGGEPKRRESECLESLKIFVSKPPVLNEHAG